MNDENWAYGEPDGPALWTGTCRSGKSQSPIDFNGVGTGGSSFPLSHRFRGVHAIATDTEKGTFSVMFPSTPSEENTTEVSDGSFSTRYM